MTNTKNKKVASRTLLDFIEDPMRLEVVTPDNMKGKGLPDKGWVEVIDGEDSLEFSALQIEILSKFGQDNATISIKDDIELTARLMASLVVGWDESYFGPFTKEALHKVLATPRFFYVNKVINTHREERSAFFSKA